MSIVIAGAGLAGYRTADELRQAGYSGAITICGSEPHLPYDRPPLSKKALTEAATVDTTLAPREFFDEQEIELRLEAPVMAVDTEAKQVRLADSSILGYSHLIAATGLTARAMPQAEGLSGVHYLRTRDDAESLRTAASAARRALIVGGGFIGCEVAASLRAMGLSVTVIEQAESLLAPVLGHQVGTLIDRLHRSEGVGVHTGSTVRSIESIDGKVTGVTLSDGTTVDTELLVVGIGGAPATGWLKNSGVEIGNGVLADHQGRTSVDGVWTVGDVAAWHDGTAHRRVEHWTNVGMQAKVVANAIVSGAQASPAPQPTYFWSDQYGAKLQCVGDPMTSDMVHIVEDDGRRFVAYYERTGQLSAIVGLGMPTKVLPKRNMLNKRIEFPVLEGR